MRRQTAPDVRLPFLCSSCLHDLAVVCTALRGRQLGRVQKRRAAPCAATATQVAAYRLLLGGRGASDRRPVFATTRRAAVPQQQTDRQASATRQPTEAHAPGMHLHVRASQQSSPLNSATIAPALGSPFPPRRGIYSLELEQRAQQHRDCLRVQKRRAACATLPGKLTTTRSVPAEKPAVTIGKRKIA